MLVPTVGFVVLIGFLGIYVAAAIFIAFFMCWLGNYSLVKAIPVGVAIPIVLFWLFEIAFLIPLPKGPLEVALGYCDAIACLRRRATLRGRRFHRPQAGEQHFGASADGAQPRGGTL